MAKKNDSYIIRAKGSEQLQQVVNELHSSGYVMMPKAVSGGEQKPPTWEDTISAQLSCSSPTDGNNAEARKQAGMLFVSSGTEQPTPDKVGTKGLGYISWGFNDRLPNLISLFTKLAPYTSSGWEFNTNIIAGMGPQPMYRFSRYIAGNVKTEEIPYSTAGILLEGMRLEILREIRNLKNSEYSENSDYSESLQKQLKRIDDNYQEWQRVNGELQDFIKRNNLHATYLNVIGDFAMLYNSFVELQLNQKQIDPNTGKAANTTMWQPRVVGIKFRPCHTSRLERMDKENVIKNVYLSNRWYDQLHVTTDAIDETSISALPLLSMQSPTTDLERRVREAKQKRVSVGDRPTRFMMHIKYPSPGNPYYAIAPWHSIFGGDIYEYAVTMISDRLTRKKNSNVIGRIIYVHNEYLQQIANQRTEEELRKQRQRKNGGVVDRTSIFDTKIKMVQSELFSEINTWMSNRNNGGQSLLAYLFRDNNGNMVESFKVVEIESASKKTAEANQKELSEISSIIFFAMGLDSRLIGNTPGSDTGTSGTDMRERYMLKQLQKAPIQQLLLKPLEVVAQFNNWDTEHLVFRIKREVLTTLDNSKTGIIEQKSE